MAQLTHSSQLTASPSSTIDISKIVRTELLKETCHATRSDLQKEFAQITNAVGSMIEVSQIRVDRLLPLVRDAHEKEALLKRQLEIKRADHLENWTDYFTLVLPHDVEDQDLQFFEVAKAKGAGHQKQRHDAPQRTPRTSPQPCYRRLRCCCIVMLLFQILMWLLLMWSLGLIDIGCSLVSAPVMWAAVSGECTQNGTCVASPNFPGKYGHMQKCVLGINLASVVPIRVEHFRTEQRYDKLVVNGVEYSGTASPDGVIPTASITWTSDGDHSNQGWRLCEAPVEPVDAALELARERVTAAEVLRQPMQFCCDHFDIGCSLVSAPVMWAAVSGECTQNGTCVASPNFPGKYGHMQKCVLGINLASVVPIRVEHFRTEHGYDKLVVNGVEYSGTASPDGVIPTASITWTSDGDHSHQGWRLCEGPVMWAAVSGECTQNGSCVAMGVPHAL
ncbi:unnamed protein product [Prorocentrum cordatum]|uniref:Uncharacterized protein n=1 Tax=Prorocentrum cordatum TaxID=2364126 RepID=A0ABN9PKM2_9DINO|nr:unnamed protein product [Polarella glacialis]